jgi:hypothetical protein
VDAPRPFHIDRLTLFGSDDVKRVSILVLLLVALAGCRPAASAATRPTGSAAPNTAPSTPATAGPTPTTTGAQLPDDGPPGLLAAIRTEHLADHDRVVFQFHGRQVPTAVIRYVERVSADPSDRPVPLQGKAFLRIAVHGARLDTAPVESDPSKARRYAGPTRLTPGYPVLAELAVAGDFEAVLSFGVGLSTVAGLTTSTSPGTLVVDLWRTAPDALLWPVTTLAQARQLQDDTRAGHQPWTLNASDVATNYTQNVLGWRQATVRRLSATVFEAGDGAQLAVLTLRQPLGGTDTVWVVAAVVRSNT